MELRKVGFYRELGHGDRDGPSLLDQCGDLDAALSIELSRYLSAGEVIVASAGAFEDVLAPEKGRLDALGYMTDGEWVWPTDLQYYVRNYRVGLPSEFVNHVIKENWRMRSFTEEEIDRIADFDWVAL